MHLKVTMELSERRACQIISADRMTVRYRSSRPPELELRAKLRDLADERRRFGYRRLFVLLRRDGEPSCVNRIYRLYREEGLSVSSKQRQMPAGRWISSTTSSPAADASVSSMWSTMSRAKCLSRAAVFYGMGIAPWHDESCGLAVEADDTEDKGHADEPRGVPEFEGDENGTMNDVIGALVEDAAF